jgi:hypothetical protein
MTTPSPFLGPPNPFQLSISGVIVTWDAVGRWLRIGEFTLLVAPEVEVTGLSETGLRPGTRVTASGRKAAVTAPWIVTELMLG